MTRIGDTRTGHASYEMAYAIGYHSCMACGTETPDPPQSLFDKLAAEQSSISTVWPFEQWTPAGWMEISAYGQICDTCWRAVARLLAGRATSTPNPTVEDFEILRQNVADALALADTALLSGFPPAPVIAEMNQRWSHIGSYELRRTYYGEDAFRRMVRAIKNVLIGLPAETDK